MQKAEELSNLDSLELAMHIVFIYFFEKSGKNGYEVAEAMGMTSSSFSRALNGKRSISFSEMICFCEFLGLPFSLVASMTVKISKKKKLLHLFRRSQEAKADSVRLLNEAVAGLQ